MSNNSSSPECAFCGRGLTVPILKNIPKNGSVYDVSECADCEIAMIHPLPSDAELTRLYSCGNYRTDEGKRFGPLIETLILFSRILKRRSINRFVKPGKILDIGCGRGLFLDVMRRGGWKTIGTELNKETASYACVGPLPSGRLNEVNLLLTTVPKLSRVNSSITVRTRNDRLCLVLSWTKSYDQTWSSYSDLFRATRL